jgi:tetratricopeptide (TPR) repeat protein
MQDSGPKIPLRVENLPEVLSKKLENETAILEALLVALAKGQALPEFWQRLHDAALRDDRLSELAFAYERIAQDRRLRIMPAPAQAQVALHAADFFSECFGDLDGAVASLERVLQLVPGHPEGYEKLVAICERRRDKERLIQLYLGMATPKADKETQLEHLRKALALSADGDEERTIKIAQQLLRVEPADEQAITLAEHRLLNASRFNDVAKMLEQALAASQSGQGLDADAALSMRERLIELYDTKLAEIERAMPHVEEVLAAKPGDDAARKVANRLLTHKVMAPRAAAALERVYEAEGDAGNVARMLGLQIEQLRGPKKTEAQKRLAKLHLELGDASAALGHLEAVVLADGGDEEARHRYVECCVELGKLADAARVLARAAAGAKDAGLRGRVNADLGRVYVELGDAKRAKQVLVNVLDTAGDDLAVLVASRTILPLYEEKEAKQAAIALGKLAELEPEAEDRVLALAKLAEVAERDLDDAELAIDSLRKLMELAPTQETSDGLARLYEATDKHADLADLLEGRARSLGSSDEARDLWLRVANLREAAADRSAAVSTLQKIVATFGPARDVHASLIPLLEQARQIPELLETLTAEAELCEDDERTPVLVKIAQVHARQGDQEMALSFFAQALALTPKEPSARSFVERAMREGALRLAAAEILVPIYDAEGEIGGLVSALEVRAELSTNAADKLQALGDASDLARSSPKEQGRALGLAGQGLVLAVATDPDLVGPWVDRTQDLVPIAGAEAVAQTLVGALGGRTIEHPAIAQLARAAGGLLVECGDSKGALDIYRALLVYEPQNHELLATVDGLLEEQGSPADRVRLYETALERHTEPARRRELFHKIGAVQRRDLGEVRAAVETYRRALAEFPDDKAFRGALYAALEASQSWGELYEDLARAAETASAEERPHLERRLAEVSLSADEPERAARHFAAVLASAIDLVPVHLDAAEGLAVRLDDAHLLRQVLERRLAAADSPEAEIALLERVGALEEGPIGDKEAAVGRFAKAAELAEGLDDPARALAFHDRVLVHAPDRRDTLERVISIARSTDDVPRLVAMTRALISASDDLEEQIALALSLEPSAAADVDGFVSLLDGLSEKAGQRLDVLSAKARVLSAVDARRAADTYKTMLSDLGDSDALEAAELFERFLAARPEAPEHHDDRRAFFAFRAGREGGAERRRILLGWARAEREMMGDPARALGIAEELVTQDPDDVEALELSTELSLELGRFEDAAGSLRRRISLGQGEARHTLSVALMDLLLDKLGKPSEALEVAEPLLVEVPTDVAAQRAVLRALETPGCAARALGILDRAAEHVDELEDRAKLYEALLAVPSTEPRIVEARPELFDKLLACLKDAPDRALAIALRAVGEYPAEEALWDRAEKLAREAKQPDRVAMAYRQTLVHAATRLSPEVAMQIGQRGVDFQEEWFDDPEAVTHMLKLVVDVAPTATWAFERLKLVYNSGERWGDLFALYDRVIEGTEDRAERATLLDDAAQVAKDLAGDPERAILYLEALHALDKSDSRTANALERLYERHAKHAPLITLLFERVDGAKPEAKSALLLRIAQLYIDGLGELDEGRKVAEQVLAADPSSREAVQALERVLALTGGPTPVVSDAGGRLEHLLRLGGRAYQGTESKRPPASRKGKSIPPGRRSAPPPRGSVPPESLVAKSVPPPSLGLAELAAAADGARATARVRQSAALTLKAHHLAGGRAAEASTMIEIALEAPESPAQRNGLLRELIELERGALGVPAKAFDTLAVLATLEPLDESLRKELEKRAKELDCNDKLVDVLLAISERTDNERDAIDLLEAASAICRREGGDSARSISIDLRILSRSDRDPQKAKDAARQLDQRLAEAGRDAERCGVLERLADLETDVSARGQVLHEIARLADNVLGDPARAARALRRRLEDAPEDVVALSALVDNLRAAHDHKELAKALERRVELVDVPERQRRDLVELARVSATELDDREAAIAAFERVVTDFGADDEVADELAVLLRDAGHLGRLAALLSTEAERAKDDFRAASSHAALGDLYREQEQPSLAAEAYCHALERVPGTTLAEIGIEALLPSLETEPDLYAKTVRALDSSYRTTDAWEKSIALVPARLTAAKTDPDRATVLLEAADLEEKRANDPGLAVASTFRAFALQPERGGVAAELLRRARLSGRWDLVAPTLLEKLEGRVVPPQIARDLFVEASDWASREDADTTRVEALLEAALERRPDDVEVLTRLVEARRRAPSEKLVTALVDLAGALVDRAADPEATLTPKAIDCYKEALTVALRALGSHSIALEVGTTLLAEVERRWRDVAASGDREEVAACAEAAEMAIDVLVALHRGELGGPSDPRKVFDVLARGAALPFDERMRRGLDLRAAEVADPAEGITIFRRWFDKDPHDEEVTSRLEALLVAERRKPEVAEVRARQIEAARSVEERISLRISLAQLFEEIGDRDAAERVLLENLAEMPTHPATVGFLARLYEHQGKTKELVGLWEGQALAQESIDPSRAVDTWTRVATLSENEVGDLSLAIKARRRITDLAANETSLDELARVLEKAGKHADAATVLERLVAEVSGSGRSVNEALVLRLSTAYEKAGQRERALAWLEKGEALPDATSEIRSRLRHAYRAASMFEPLAALLARDASSSPDPATRLSRLREAAALYTGELGQPARAIPLLEEALDLDKSDLSTRLLLSDAMRAERRFEGASEILQGLLDEYGSRRPKERALVHYELAKVSLSLGDRAKAMAELDAASKIDQGHPGILHALAKLALEEGQLLRAQRTFRALLLVVKAPRGAAASREAAFASTPMPDAAARSLEPQVSRAEVLVELAAISEKQGEDERRTEFIESAFEAAKESAWEAEQLTIAFGARGWHALTVRVLDERAKEATSDRERASLLLSRADLLADALSDVAQASEAALAAVELDPTSKRAHARALELTKREGTAAKYIALLGKLGGRDDLSPELSIELALAEARAKEQELADDAGARAAYERVLDRIESAQEPQLGTKLEVLASLEHVLERLGERKAQADTLAKIVELGNESGRGFGEQAEALYRLARLRFATGEIDDATDVLDNAVEIDPDPVRAEKELYAALALAPKSLRVARRFEDLCRARDRKEPLVDALVAVADRDEDPLSPLREAYELSLELGLKEEGIDRAEKLLLRIIELAGDSEAGAFALVALGERRSDQGDLAEAADLFERAASVSSPDEERALLLGVAKLCDASLGDPERAIRIYESLRKREPADRDVWAPLAAVYQKKGDVPSLSALLEETIPLVDDLEERARLRLSLADMIVGTDAPRAAEILGEVLEDDPQNARAGQLLTEIYARTGEKEKLAELLAKRLDVAKDAEDKAAIVAISLDLGKLLEEQENDSEALTVYHSVLDWDDSSREALRAIVRLGMKRDDSVGVGDELDRLLAIEEGQAAVDLAFKVAQMKRAMGDESGAERALLAGMRARPDSAELRDELVRVYTDRGATRELADLKRLEIGGLKDPTAKKAGYMALAETYREKVGDAAAAASCLGDAHAIDPTDRDVLFVLMDSWSALGEHQKAIDAVDRSIAEDASGDASWLYFSRAVLREALGDSDAALDDLEEAHATSGGKYGNELKAHLEAAVVRIGREPASSRRTEAETRLRLAEVTAEVGDEEGARAILGELIRKDPRDRAALRALAKIDETAERWEGAIAHLRRLVAIEEGPELVDTAKRIARAAMALGRPEDARVALERAQRAAPSDDSVRALLKDVYRQTGEAVGLASMLVEEARAAGDVDGRHALLLEAARYLISDEHHAADALQLLEEVRSLKPEDSEAQVLLSLGLTASGRVAEARTLAKELVAAQRGRRSRELGRAYYALHKAEARDGNLSEALDALSRAFENDPQNATLAMELGLAAVDIDDAEVAQRAFRSVTLLKTTPNGEGGVSAREKAVAYFHLGRISVAQGDRRRAKLMLEKAISEDPELDDAHALLGTLGS